MADFDLVRAVDQLFPPHVSGPLTSLFYILLIIAAILIQIFVIAGASKSKPVEQIDLEGINIGSTPFSKTVTLSPSTNAYNFQLIGGVNYNALTNVTIDQFTASPANDNDAIVKNGPPITLTKATTSIKIAKSKSNFTEESSFQVHFAIPVSSIRIRLNV